jgi:hypothetical protein
MFVLVIETNKYAGNFEREMCAFVTVQIGECGVGDKIASKVENELPDFYERMDEIIGSQYDDNGCSRPTSGAINKNGEYNNVEIYFNEMPNDSDMIIIRKRINEFRIKTLEIRLKERIVVDKDIW